MAVDITVRGDLDVIAALKSIPGAMAGDTLELAATAGAELLRDAIRAAAPVKEGTLREDIKIATLEKSPLHAVVGVGAGRKGFYWRFAERGTRHQLAKPFIGPTTDANQGAAQGAVQEVLADAIT